MEERREAIEELQKQTEGDSEKVKAAQTRADECPKSCERARIEQAKLGHAIPIVNQIGEQRLIIEQTHDPKPTKGRAELPVKLRALLSVNSSKTDKEVVSQALSLPQYLGQLSSRIREFSTYDGLHVS